MSHFGDRLRQGGDARTADEVAVHKPGTEAHSDALLGWFDLKAGLWDPGAIRREEWARDDAGIFDYPRPVYRELFGPQRPDDNGVLGALAEVEADDDDDDDGESRESEFGTWAIAQLQPPPVPTKEQMRAMLVRSPMWTRSGAFTFDVAFTFDNGVTCQMTLGPPVVVEL